MLCIQLNYTIHLYCINFYCQNLIPTHWNGHICIYVNDAAASSLIWFCNPCISVYFSKLGTLLYSHIQFYTFCINTYYLLTILSIRILIIWVIIHVSKFCEFWSPFIQLIIVLISSRCGSIQWTQGTCITTLWLLDLNIFYWWITYDFFSKWLLEHLDNELHRLYRCFSLLALKKYYE